MSKLLLGVFLLQETLGSLILLQVAAETPEQKGLFYVALSGMAAAVVAMAIFIRQQFKEVKEAHQKATEQVRQIFQENGANVQKIYDQVTNQYRDVTDRNTRAMIENTNETRALGQLLRDKLAK